MLSQEQAEIDHLQALITQLQFFIEKSEKELILSIEKNSEAYKTLLPLLGALRKKIVKYQDQVVTVLYDIHNLSNEEPLTPLDAGLIRKTSWSCSVDPVLQTVKTEQEMAIVMQWIYKKQLNGITRLVTHGPNGTVSKYDISSRFFAMYCTKKISLTDCPKVDLSCRRCELCQQHHFALHLIAWGKELEIRVKERSKEFEFTCGYFSQSEWRSILASIPSQCVPDGRQWRPSATRYQFNSTK